MNTSRSLFATAFKDTNQRPAFGIKRSVPFLNYWVPAAASTPAPRRESSATASRRRHYHRHQHQQPGLKREYSTSSIEIEKDNSNMASATSFYEFKPLDKKGQPVPLTNYSNKVVLIINTASKCGFTPQYEGLEALYKKLKAQYGDDVEFLGFPCNQFGSQEPGSDDDIQSFCQINYGVSFPIMGKTDVNGDQASPLYEWLKREQPGLLGLKRVKWNFEKFLVGRDGKVAGRWASTTKPEALEKPIVDALAKK